MTSDFRLETEHYSCYWSAAKERWMVESVKSGVIVESYDTVEGLLRAFIRVFDSWPPQSEDDIILFQAIKDVLK